MIDPIELKRRMAIEEAVADKELEEAEDACLLHMKKSRDSRIPILIERIAQDQKELAELQEWQSKFPLPPAPKRGWPFTS